VNDDAACTALRNTGFVGGIVRALGQHAKAMTLLKTELLLGSREVGAGPLERAA
jgi:hypothetical protein